MTLRYLLDTNICIYTLKRRPPQIRERFNRHAAHLAISSVVLAELLYGAEKSSRPEHNLEQVEDFAARLEVLPFDASTTARSRSAPCWSGPDKVSALTI